MPDDKTYCVYRHTSPSGKVYIGITCQDPILRWNKGWGYKHNRYFMSAITKYGWDNFAHEILFDGLTKVDACDREIELIRLHQSNNRDFGYNISTGGEFGSAGCKPSEETRRKISDCQKGEKAFWYGKRFSDDHRRKMSEANRGTHVSEEAKKLLSENHRKYTVIQITLEGEIVARFPTTGLAAESVGCSKTQIWRACHNPGRTAKGYKWKYEPI